VDTLDVDNLIVLDTGAKWVMIMISNVNLQKSKSNDFILKLIVGIINRKN
jgi:hypothetical protein